VCIRNDLYENVAEISVFPPINPPAPIYIFAVPAMINGDLTLGIYPDGRTGGNTICQGIYATTFSFLNVTTVQAFISVNASDQIKDLVPVSMGTNPVYGVNGVSIIPITAAWNDLWSGGNILNDLFTSIGIIALWWSGSLSDGTAGNTCSNWTSFSNAFTGTSGSQSNINTTWVSFGSTTCNIPHYLLCVAY
jgi:hypothetical protein